MAVSYVPATYGSVEKKSEAPAFIDSDRKIARQIDSLQRISRSERNKQIGENHIQDMKDFQSLAYYSSSATTSYRRRIILPELQFLAMSESTDLTNDSPKFYISVNGKRDEQREKALAAAWRNGMYNNRIFDAVLWSQYTNPSWLQLGFNPDARSGKGSVWLSARDPDTVDPDPHARNDKTWSYVITEDWFYIDEIRRMWPEKGKYVRANVEAEQPYDEQEGSSYGLSMDLPQDSSLRIDAPEGFENSRKGSRKRVRYLWIKDYAKEAVREIAGNETAEGIELLVSPILKWKYPGGRFIVECDGIVLADGPNFVPKLPEDDFATFPIIGLWSFPHLESIYGPPPVRYGKSSQETAEFMMQQAVENAVRTNNAQCWIPKDSGIDIDAYGGLAGEVQVYDGEKPPTMTWPSAMPQHMMQMPQTLLQLVDKYQGWNPQRQGEAGAGNVSPDLFDAAVIQSKDLNRMKARFLSETYQRVASLMFYMMVRFKVMPDQLRPAFGKDKEACKWMPIPDGAECELMLDDASVQAISKTALQKVVSGLAKTGALPTKYVLESFDIPNAEELGDQAEKQQALAALSKLKKPR